LLFIFWNFIFIYFFHPKLEILNFGHCNLFVIWCLMLGIYLLFGI